MYANALLEREVAIPKAPTATPAEPGPEFSLQAFIETLSMYPADEEYCFSDIYDCPLTRHFTRFGYSRNDDDYPEVGRFGRTWFWVRPETIGDYPMRSEFFNIVTNSPRTYGAALARAKDCKPW